MNHQGESSERRYSYGDIQQILHLAIARQSKDDDGFTWKELEDVAEELEISVVDLKLAEQAWANQSQEEHLRQTFQAYRWERLRHRGIRFVIVNGFLALISFGIWHTLVSLYYFWVLAWGLRLTLQAWTAAQVKGEAFEQEFLRWNRRRQLNQTVNQTVSAALKGVNRLLRPTTGDRPTTP